MGDVELLKAATVFPATLSLQQEKRAFLMNWFEMTRTNLQVHSTVPPLEQAALMSQEQSGILLSSVLYKSTFGLWLAQSEHELASSNFIQLQKLLILTAGTGRRYLLLYVHNSWCQFFELKQLLF